MFKNHLKIATRNLLKNKLFSSINIAGLALGSTCFLVILLYVFSQFQYDKHHKHGDSIYRVETTITLNDEVWPSSSIAPPIVHTMLEEFPEVVNVSRVVGMMGSERQILISDNKPFFESKGLWVDSTFFQVFDYEWMEGNAENALQEPYTIVLTKEVKEKIFGAEKALGKTIVMNNEAGKSPFKITGVVDASANKSHIRGRYYIAMNSGGIGEFVRGSNAWAGQNFLYGYVQLHPDADAEALAAKLPDFLQKHGGDQLKEMGMNKELSLQLVPDIHLFSEKLNQVDQTGNLSLLKILLIIAGFILVIACVNFMNLATAKSIKRGVEVGIRKTIGADRISIATQFYIESFLITGLALLLAVFASYFLLFSTSNFISDQIQLNASFAPIVIGSTLILYMIIGLLAGSYPALYLSSFQPINIIKGFFKKGTGQDRLRKSLVVFQFTISIGMILGAIVIMNQVRYMQSQDLGFDQKRKIMIPFRTEFSRNQMDAFKNQTLQLSGVVNAASTRVRPGERIQRDVILFTPESSAEFGQNIVISQGDEDILETLGVPILQGRNYSPADTNAQILINETGLEVMNIPKEKAIGQELLAEGNGDQIRFRIVGVVQDYNQSSLRDPMKPMIFQYTSPENNFALMVDATLAENKNLIGALEKQWNKMIPEVPFEYNFLDDQLQSQYEAEMQLAKIINLFTFIAIFISCLGLFGLSVFVAEQRNKEIGIRKVLGASTSGLVILLSKGFIKLICIALVIATPISWYFMNDWLESFAYRIDIQWWTFVLTGIVAIGIGLFTVGFNSLKAALSNPVKAIKEE